MIPEAYEAEQFVLGYLLENRVPIEEKGKVVLALNTDLFITESHRKVLKVILEHKVYDRIVLAEKLKELDLGIDFLNDLSKIPHFFGEVDSNGHVRSYINILEYKSERRRVYNIGEAIKVGVNTGEDHHVIALKAIQELSEVSSHDDVKDVLQLFDDILEGRVEQTTTTGYDVLDEHTGGFIRGNVNTIAGDSGHMKTTMAIDMALRIVEKDPELRVGIFSKEMLAEDMAKKIMCRLMRIEMRDIIQNNYDKKKAREVLYNYKPFGRITIVPPSHFGHAGEIAKYQLSKRFDVWFVDYAQLLDGIGDKVATDSSEFNLQVLNNTKVLKGLSIATKSVGMMLSQVVKGVDKRVMKKPTVSDLEWSGIIKQLSAYILFSYYPYKYYKNKELATPEDYFIYSGKTRYSGDFTIPMKVEEKYGVFNPDLTRTEKLQMMNKFSHY